MKQIFTILVLLVAVGCETLDESDSASRSLEDIVKASGEYVSTNAREFTLSARAYAPFPEGYTDLDREAQLAAVETAMDRRLNVIARAVKRHIDGVLRPLNNGVTGEKAAYFTYFRRNESSSADYVAPAGLDQFEFEFELEFVGSYYLMSKLSPPTGSARRTFDVEVTDVSQGGSSRIEFEISGQPSHDAFPRYRELFEDGIFDIGIHFGGDYNEERLDLETAKWLVELLIEDGWVNDEVNRFEELEIDSAPFTRSLVIENQSVEVRVYIYHSDMVESSEEMRLTEVMHRSLESRDVVFYSGHAGENAGFILDYQPRHEIKAIDFSALLLAQKYQIYLLDGCRTYRTYVRDLMTNERKSFETLDLVTTVNTTPFSAGYRLIYEFLYWFTITNDEGAHFPISWKDVLRGVNTRTLRSVHYGVHGIANNPKLNPHGSEDTLCKPCDTDSQCGSGGNFCLDYPGQKACGVACTTDRACGDGFRCARITQDPKLFYLPKQCVKKSYRCD
jgi:hypothetical protein